MTDTTTALPAYWNRFWAKVDASGDCWIWTAARLESGYGRFGIGTRATHRVVYTHRLAWEILVGPIGDGLQIDHLCKNRSCCNPDHLEPVNPAVNVARSSAGWNQLTKTHCPQGHEYNQANTRIYRDHRYCRACQRVGVVKTPRAHKAESERDVAVAQLADPRLRPDPGTQPITP